MFIAPCPKIGIHFDRLGAGFRQAQDRLFTSWIRSRPWEPRLWEFVAFCDILLDYFTLKPSETRFQGKKWPKSARKSLRL